MLKHSLTDADVGQLCHTPGQWTCHNAMWTLIWKTWKYRGILQLSGNWPFVRRMSGKILFLMNKPVLIDGILYGQDTEW